MAQKLVKVKNPYCPLFKKPCIERECDWFRTKRRLSDYEYGNYMAADIPVNRIEKTKWCSIFKFRIPPVSKIIET